MKEWQFLTASSHRVLLARELMKPNNQSMKLDLLGQYYASIINPKQPGIFAISVYLKEEIDPKILQQAMNDLIERLPFLNGRLKRGFFHYKHELIVEPPCVKPLGEEPLFSDYYNRGEGHMINVSYGKQHFTVRTTHSICDGRGLSKVTSALLVRYFECLGVEILDKVGIIDCSDEFQQSEAEDACERYAALSQKLPKEKPPKRVKAYRSSSSRFGCGETLTKIFDSAKIKELAKSHNVTVTEYLLAQIFLEIAKERNSKKSKKPITAMVPIDCRSFFPSNTLRSFVSSATITMPETKNFPEMLQQINMQFKKISKDTVLAELRELQSMYNSARYVPRVIKALFMRIITLAEAPQLTSGLSNLGLIKLPLEIEKRVDYFEFPISLEADTPYFFSCVTVGNALAFTATFRDDGRSLINGLFKRLEELG